MCNNGQNLAIALVYKETLGRLKSLSRRVAEGRDVMAASEFARWLNFSGILRLCEENPQDDPFKVDGAFLGCYCQLLIDQCNERFRTNNFSPKFESDDFQSLHDKVDAVVRNLETVAGYMAKMTVSGQISVRGSGGAAGEVDGGGAVIAMPRFLFHENKPERQNEPTPGQGERDYASRAGDVRCAG